MKKYLLIAIKAALTIAILVFLIGRIDLAPVMERFEDLNYGYLLLAALCLVVQIPLAALRWSRILEMIEARPPFLGAVRLIIIGNFFNQAMPSVIAGDASRIWFLRKWGFRLGTAVNSVIVDRAVGVLGLALLAGTGLPYAASVLPQSNAVLGLSMMVALVVLAYGFLVFTGTDLFKRLDGHGVIRSIRQVGVMAWQVSRRFGPFMVLVLLALMLQFLLVVCFIFLGEAIGAPLDFAKAVVIVPPVILFSMIPVTFAGWGLRETAMVTAVTLMGGQEADAFAISVLFGLTLLAVYLPGGMLWWRVKARIPDLDTLEATTNMDAKAAHQPDNTQKG